MRCYLFLSDDKLSSDEESVPCCCCRRLFSIEIERERVPLVFLAGTRMDRRVTFVSSVGSVESDESVIGVSRRSTGKPFDANESGLKTGFCLRAPFK